MNTYEKVKRLLECHSELRNSDKKLLWKYWNDEIPDYEREEFYISYGDFLNCTPAESITRARRAVQKHHPELQASKKIKQSREEKAKNPSGWLF
jgi:hypothetical protein